MICLENELGCIAWAMRFSEYPSLLLNIHSSPYTLVIRMYIYLQFLCLIWCNSSFVHGPCHTLYLFYISYCRYFGGTKPISTWYDTQPIRGKKCIKLLRFVSITFVLNSNGVRFILFYFSNQFSAIHTKYVYIYNLTIISMYRSPFCTHIRHKIVHYLLEFRMYTCIYKL